MTDIAYVGFGSNLGDSQGIFEATIKDLDTTAGVHLLRFSPMYSSKPIDVTDAQKNYLNAVIEVETSLDAEAVLRRLNEIEDKHGRVRGDGLNQARTLDLDLLLYGKIEAHSETLTLPHPRMHLRAFVLYPLSDLSPKIEIPGRGEIGRLMARVAAQAITRL